MKKNYSSDDILKMSVGLIKSKYDADLNSDGKITADDARIKLNSESGNGNNTAALSEDKLNSIASLSSGLNVNSEKLYNYYRDIYSKDALKASENAYGLASRNTGGYGNSYASSIAAEAYENYMDGLYDKFNEASENAYKNTVSFAETAADYGDYSYLEALGADMSTAKRNDALAEAISDAKYGDYSGLEYMGVDTSLLRYRDLLEFAGEMSEYGDYSGLEALGIDVTSLKENGQLEKALALAKYGDLSLLGELSGNISSLKSKISTTIQKGAASAYSNGGYSALVKYLNNQVGYGQITEADKKQIISVVTS